VRTGALRPAVVPQPEEWTPRLGPAELLCWGVLRSGLLRHPVLVGHRPLA
jgi:hypothetical protein